MCAVPAGRNTVVPAGASKLRRRGGSAGYHPGRASPRRRIGGRGGIVAGQSTFVHGEGAARRGDRRSPGRATIGSPGRGNTKPTTCPRTACLHFCGVARAVEALRPAAASSRRVPTAMPVLRQRCALRPDRRRHASAVPPGARSVTQRIASPERGTLASTSPFRKKAVRHAQSSSCLCVIKLSSLHGMGQHLTSGRAAGCPHGRRGGYHAVLDHDRPDPRAVRRGAHV